MPTAIEERDKARKRKKRREGMTQAEKVLDDSGGAGSFLAGLGRHARGGGRKRPGGAGNAKLDDTSKTRPTGYPGPGLRWSFKGGTWTVVKEGGTDD